MWLPYSVGASIIILIFLVSFGATFPLCGTSYILLLSLSSLTYYLHRVVATGQLMLPELIILISVLTVSPGLQVNYRFSVTSLELSIASELLVSPWGPPLVIPTLLSGAGLISAILPAVLISSLFLNDYSMFGSGSTLCTTIGCLGWIIGAGSTSSLL